MQIEISNNIFLTDYDDSFGLAVIEKLTMTNPAYDDAVKMGRWTGNLPKTLEFYREEMDGLTIPRGCLDLIRTLAKTHGEEITVADFRRTLPEVEFTFTGKLRDFQAKAVEAILHDDFGTLNAPTGSGKTIMALAIIEARRQPTLIVVHNKELLKQWIDRIVTFTGIRRADIGQIGDGKKTIKPITVGIVNSVYPIAAPVLKQHFGQVIVDECHRCPSRTFSEAVSAFDCRFMLGLSATPFRRDGLTKLISWHLGPCRHSIDRAALQNSGDIVPADVIIKSTRFRSFADASTEYAKMLSELTEDRDRNIQICADVIKEAGNGGGVCLVLTDRKEHAETLATIIKDCGVHADQLTGDLSGKDRQAVVDRLNAGAVKVLIATGQLIGEGFDCRGLNTLFMATPISFHGRLIQYLGRVLRPAPGKIKAKVYDYVDPCGVLQAAAQKRRTVYRNNQWNEVQNVLQ